VHLLGRHHNITVLLTFGVFYKFNITAESNFEICLYCWARMFTCPTPQRHCIVKLT